MDNKTSSEIKAGDRVKVLHGTGRDSGLVGRVIELRGPLGPKGAEIYLIRISRKPKPAYVEVTADQLIVVPAES
jgi:hypothetical protein